jgi:hypothetical protein
MTGTSLDNQNSTFSVDAKRVVRGLQGGLGEILDALPSYLGRAQEFARFLKIDKQLAWRVVKVVGCTDPFAAGQYVPGQAAFKLFLQAVEKANVRAALIKNANEAFARFEELIQIHAGGDRGSLEMMLIARAKKDRKTADQSHRRMAFRGNSHIWGVQAKTHLKISIVQPSSESDKLDIAVINGFFMLRQLRDGAPLSIARMKSSEYDKNGRRLFSYESIEPNAEQAHGIYLLSEFCSQPLPELLALDSDKGFVNYELKGRGIGDTFATTCVEGSVVRGVARRFRNEHNMYGENCANICIPTETLILDFIIREDTFGLLKPISLVYGENLRRTFYPAPNRERDLLDIHEPVTHLGRGTSVLHSSSVPRYASMGRYVFDKLGWEADRFDVYRFQLDYPVVPSTVVLRHDLPEMPDQQLSE